MKKQAQILDATPPKEIYRSIIVDYDIKLGICELVDNAIDIWSKTDFKKKLAININLDLNQQKITITDNAGGIKEEDILLFISPGRTGNTATEETIGIFGVGSKRAVVALAQNIKMTTRRSNQKTFQIEFDENWLEDDSWDLPVYEVSNIEPNTTTIELLGLRSSLDTEIVERVGQHLSTTYALFLNRENLKIMVNEVGIVGKEFDKDWAFPPQYGPKCHMANLEVENDVVRVGITGGVVGEKVSKGGESGVYFYCNDRLIAKSLKDYEVGYSSGKAGQANHPGGALGRVIIKLNGQAQYMPWNSSKSAINYQHKIFQSIRKSLIEVLSYYVGLSKRTQGDWPGQIFKYKKGKVKYIEITQLDRVNDLYNIPLPRTRMRYEEKLVDKNRELGKRKPWVVGLYEAIAAVELITKKNFKQKNRLALILLDSNLEIALKEYLVHEVNIGMNKFKNIKENRSLVIEEVKKHQKEITEDEWQKIRYFYVLRNNLIHERATSPVDDDDLSECRALVQKVLNRLFALEF